MNSDAKGARAVWDKDVPSFGVRTNKSGSTVYILNLSINGRTKTLTLCDTRVLLLDQARAIALRAKTLARASNHSPDEIAAMVRRMVAAPVGALKVENAISFGRFSEIYMREYSKVHKKRRTVKKDESYLRYLTPLWKDKPLDKISRKDVIALHLSMKKTPYAANRVVETICSIWNTAIYMGYLPNTYPNPGAKIKKYRELDRDRILNDDELDRILAALEKMRSSEDASDRVHGAALTLAFHTGFRHSEIVELRWSQIDFTSREILFEDTKANRSFRFPMSDEVVDLLQGQRSKSVWCFPSPLNFRGNHHIDRLDRALKRIMKEANVENFRVHDIRRTFGSRLVKQTGSLRLVGELLNQSQPSVTAIYARYQDKDKRAALSVNSKEIARVTNLPAVVESEIISPTTTEQNFAMLADLIAGRIAEKMRKDDIVDAG